ncbi:hypothetical protein KBB45_04475 [Myxococcota bacterium]|jgi:hypothetical protein|nr:hypothetical protein [Myxococcota bacterium]MBP8970617.1 hypothetical protein [Myxococcota bacterium]HHW97383.1 hypothetical protein [Oligoflexales bacterium]
MARFYSDGDFAVDDCLGFGSVIEARGIRAAYAKIEIVGDKLFFSFSGHPGKFQPFLVDGVGLANVMSGERSSFRLIIWDDSRDVVLTENRGARQASLVMKGSYTWQTDIGGSSSTDFTLTLLFPSDSISIQRVKDNRDNAGMVERFSAAHAIDGMVAAWPDKVLRIQKPPQDGGGGPNEYLYPVCPVREEIWPYVRKFQHKFAHNKHEWTLWFYGREAEITIRENHFAWSDIAVVQRNICAALAIWPPKRIEKWRIYSVVVGHDGHQDTQLLRNDDECSVWEGPVGKDVVGRDVVGVITQYTPRECKRSKAEKRRSNVLNVTVTNPDTNAPVFISITRDRSEIGEGETVRQGGFFGLLDKQVDQATTTQLAMEFGLDLGTTTTVISASLDNNNIQTPSSINVMDGNNEMFIPKDLVGFQRNHWKQALAFPWVPTVVSGIDNVTNQPMVEIRTGVFDGRSAGGGDVRCREWYPFSDGSFVSSDVDVVKLNGAKSRWHSELKWDDRDNATEWLKIFVVTVFTWVIASKRDRASSFTIKASYPLAFSRQKRQAYFSSLRQAGERLQQITGIDVSVSSSWDGTQDEPFCDESFVLLGNIVNSIRNIIMERAQPGAAGNLNPSFSYLHADLGGGTLDLVFAACDPSVTTYRVLAAESIKFGGDTINGEILKKIRLRVGDDQPDPRDGAPEEHPLRPFIGFLIRRGEIRKLMELADGQHNGDPDYITWSGAGGREAAGLIRAWADIYISLIVEYCARFVAGTLLDSSSLEYRLNGAPGQGVWNNPWSTENGVEVLVRLSGNGWKVMQTPHCGWDQDISVSVNTFVNAFKARLNAHMDREGRNGVIVHQGQWLEKDITAKNLLYVVSTLGLDGNHIGLMAAPNGFNDSNRVSNSNGDWYTLCGEGSLINPQSTDPLEPSHAFYRAHRQQIRDLSMGDLNIDRVFKLDDSWRQWHSLWSGERKTIINEKLRSFQDLGAWQYRRHPTISALYSYLGAKINGVE